MEKQDLENILAQLSYEGKRTAIFELVNKELTQDPEYLKIAADVWARDRKRPAQAIMCIKSLNDKKLEAEIYELTERFEDAAKIYAQLGQFEQAIMTYLKSNNRSSKERAVELANQINDEGLLIYIYTRDPMKIAEAEALLEKREEHDMLLKFYEEKAHYHSAHQKAKELTEQYRELDLEKSKKYAAKAEAYKQLLKYTSVGDRKLPQPE